MTTYFISDGTLVKIGKSINPSKRCAQLQTAHTVPLDLFMTIEGDYEFQYHSMLGKDRRHGEWFEWSEATTNLVFWVVTGRPRTPADILIGLKVLD